MLLLLAGAHAAAQGQDAPLHVMRSATLERPLLVMATDAAAPGEAYVDDVRIRVAVEDGFRVYQAFHDGITRTLHVAPDAALRYVAFDPERNRFEMLSNGLRVELEDYGLLDQSRQCSRRHRRQGVPDAGIRHRAVISGRQSGRRCRRH